MMSDTLIDSVENWDLRGKFRTFDTFDFILIIPVRSLELLGRTPLVWT